LVIIVVGAGLAGMQDSVAGIVGFRALWGLGNALFIATALAAIVSSARGSVAQAIILYEAALGLGIASGPLLGGFLGGISWRGPFFGTAALMAIAFVAIMVLLAELPEPQRRALFLHAEGLGYREIAAQLAVPIGTICTWISRGRQGLARALKDLSPPGSR
jgi:MFS family permease